MSQFNTPSYDIPRTTGICAKTGRELSPGEPYFATLVDVPAEAQGDEQTPSGAAALGMQRLDVSADAWQEGFRPAHLVAYWKTTVPQPNEKKKLFVDNAVLMNLLRRLEDATEQQRLAFRYVLALILMRKKLLRFDRTRRESVEKDGETVERAWWQFTPKEDVTKGHFGRWADETIEVLDPHLDEAQIEQVTQQLGEILEAEL